MVLDVWHIGVANRIGSLTGKILLSLRDVPDPHVLDIIILSSFFIDYDLKRCFIFIALE